MKCNSKIWERKGRGEERKLTKSSRDKGKQNQTYFPYLKIPM